MGALGSVYEQRFLRALFHFEAFQSPEWLYVALFNSVVSAGGTGVEVTGVNYERLPINANSTNFTGPTADGSNGHYMRNGVAFDFGLAGAGGWGNIVSVALFDDEEMGDVVMRGLVGENRTVAAGDPVLFPINSIRFVLR